MMQKGDVRFVSIALIGFVFVLSLMSSSATSSPTGSYTLGDKNGFRSGSLENLEDNISEGILNPSTDIVLFPDELRYLEFKELLKKAEERYYATIMAYFMFPKQGITAQNKMKKNSEIIRGMHSALKDMDMFRAGR